MSTSKLKPSQSKESLKQKSLMSFFSKTPQAPATPAVKRRLQDTSSDAPPSSSPSKQTPNPRKASSSSIMSATFTGSSGGKSHRTGSPPPSSDAVDVDMLSDEELQPKKRIKRKAPVRDSDDSDSALQKAPGRTKKRRISRPPSEEPEENEEVSIGSKAFTQKLQKFKKSPRKKAPYKKRKPTSDDDDFIVPDDASDSDAASIPPEVDRRSTSRSSARSVSSLHSDEDEEDEAPRPKKAASKPSGKSQASTAALPSSLPFLTAAERSTQEKRSEKKNVEKPFGFLQDVKDKDGVRPGEPGYDPRTIHIPKTAWSGFTPFEKQFWEIKQNHYDTILFFQKGKFLELYEEDAIVGHREFDLKLTQRVKMSMVGVPEMSFNFWAAKFLGKGYKVGRVDQAETALGAEMRLAADKGKGKKTARKDGDGKIVKRELHKVYTNGTLVDEELLTDDQAGHCISIREGSGKDDEGAFGICVLDSSTSEFNLSAFTDDVCRTKLETMLRQLRPKEILFTKGALSVSTTRLLKMILPSGCLWTTLRDVEGFDYKTTLEELKKMYPPGEDDDLSDDVLPSSVPEAIRNMLGMKAPMEALGAMVWYLRQLNIDKDIMSMRNFNVYDPMKRGKGLVLDGQTLAHVEVLVNSDGTEDGSLLKLLGRCMTPSGKRLFRIWLCMPLREAEDINARLDAVEDLMNDPAFEEEFTTLVKRLPDLERIVSRIHAKNCKVKDFLHALRSFEKLSKGLKALEKSAEGFRSKCIPGLLRSAPDLMPNIKHVQEMFEKEKESDPDQLLPVAGKDEVYDEVQEEIATWEQSLEKELRKLEKQVGFRLTYWHSNIGNKDIYLVQTKADQKNVPKDWIKSGGTKAAARWKVNSLAPMIRGLKEATENRNQAIKTFKNRLFAEFDADRGVWLRAVRALSELDCLISLAKSSVALGEPRCRPEIMEGGSAFVDFTELRHPALCASERLKGDFIPNDIQLGGDKGRIALLTGPNMGGKSTVMRMTAAGVVMAQLGMFVPASNARICPVDTILTRMGAYDNMFSNASTFKVELDECCKILRDATPKSLVILDELGRGTSTYDGMAIAGAVLHQLATHTLPLTFFATHYGSLTDDFAYHPNIRNMHMKTMVDDQKRELVFLYKLVSGIASSSFGTHVASLAGVPTTVVDRADVVSTDFARQFKEKIEGRRKQDRLPSVLQADFAYLIGLVSEKEKLPGDKAKAREVLRGLKEAVRMGLLHAARPAGVSAANT